jgi:hypothetical protein
MTDRGIIIADRRTWVHDIAFTAASSLVYAFLAPLGSAALPLQERVVEDFTLGFACFPILWPPMRLALRLGDRAGLPELFVVIGGLVILAAPVAVMGNLIEHLFHPGMPPASLVSVYFMILAMQPITAAYLIVERRLTRPRVAGVSVELPEEAPAEPVSGGRARLIARLNPRLGGEVLALQGEDHYVRVHTALGSELVLMRLGDAIQELDGLDGERVHRSWWVARQAVGEARMDGRRVFLTLTNGLEVQASREATVELRRAGWLSGPGRP